MVLNTFLRLGATPAAYSTAGNRTRGSRVSRTHSGELSLNLERTIMAQNGRRRARAREERQISAGEPTCERSQNECRKLKLCRGGVLSASVLCVRKNVGGGAGSVAIDSMGGRGSHSRVWWSLWRCRRANVKANILLDEMIKSSKE